MPGVGPPCPIGLWCVTTCATSSCPEKHMQELPETDPVKAQTDAYLLYIE